jgi:hypothetical protein
VCARSDGYRDAFLANKEHFRDKVVLDVGCGTGILSIFAVDAGARKVYAVDASDIADYARQIVAANGLSGKIEVLKGKVEDVALPEKVDVIISEWMGYFLLYESMLQSVLVARDRFLKPGGSLWPESARLLAVPFMDAETFEDRVLFWRKVYGRDFSALMPLAKQSAFGDALTDTLGPEHEMALRSEVVHSFDLRTLAPDAVLPFASEVRFASAVSEECHGVCFWFDVTFPGGRVLSTAPSAHYTHWMQTLFYFDDPIPLRQDQLLRVAVRVAASAANHRHLDVDLECEAEAVLAAPAAPAAPAAKHAAAASAAKLGAAPVPAKVTKHFKLK